MTMEENFWNDKRSSSAIIKEMNDEKEIVAEFKNWNQKWEKRKY